MKLKFNTDNKNCRKISKIYFYEVTDGTKKVNRKCNLAYHKEVARKK